MTDLEWLKKDLSQLRSMLAAESGHAGPTVAALVSATVAEIRAGAAELVDQAVAVEHQLFDVNLTGAREDAFRNPNKLYSPLSALLYEVSRATTTIPRLTSTERCLRYFGNALRRPAPSTEH